MKIIDYIRERWITYIFITFSFMFTSSVYRLDRKFNISESNAVYITVGLAILFIIFVLVDFTVYSSRVKSFKSYCLNNPLSEEDLDLFTYPMDREYGKIIHDTVKEYERFKGEIRNKSSEELEFITKWIHDIKVPISALRLILESYDNHLDQELYRRMDTEIVAIEQCTQRVFYHIKSNTFYNDYKISKVNTRKLVGDSLKGYSNFFSYKKINISIIGDNYELLTDEKWSGYIISQILSNAVKHTPVNGHIAITTVKNGKEISIQIRNSGKGILSKDITQVFIKGYTSSEDRNGIKSTGYGMYLSKKLSDMLGHKLTVESEYGEYAQFNLTFVEHDTIHSVTKV